MYTLNCVVLEMAIKWYYYVDLTPYVVFIIRACNSTPTSQLATLLDLAGLETSWGFDTGLAGLGSRP